jgi:hypothetical protein
MAAICDTGAAEVVHGSVRYKIDKKWHRDAYAVDVCFQVPIVRQDLSSDSLAYLEKPIGDANHAICFSWAVWFDVFYQRDSLWEDNTKQTILVETMKA